MLGLVGDVDEAHACFALACFDGDTVTLEGARVVATADFPSGSDAINAFLDEVAPRRRPRRAVIAVAGQPYKGLVTLNSRPGWRLSEADLAPVHELCSVQIVNAFSAQALALCDLPASGLQPLGALGTTKERSTRAILGPGARFEAAALVDDGCRRAILSTEYGQAAFAPQDEVETEILRLLSKRQGRVSVEHLLSGSGLLDLYWALAEIYGGQSMFGAPPHIVQAAALEAGVAREALERFCAILGSVAGDFALAVGARGGVYIAGGIAPSIASVLAISDFRARFDEKGRLGPYMRSIPTLLITTPLATLLGAARLLRVLSD